MRFHSPEYLALLVLLPVFFAIWLKLGRRQHTLKNTQVSRAPRLSMLGTSLNIGIWTCKATLWTCLVCAMAGMTVTGYLSATDASGVIHISQDTSGSMKFGITNPNEISLARFYDPNVKDPAANAPANGAISQTKEEQQQRPARRIDASLGAIKTFILHSHGLNVGLSAFDDKFFYLYPATKNKEVSLELLENLRHYIDSHSTGTDFDSEKGALQGAVNLFRNEPKDVVHIWIMVTDGDATINEKRAEELKEQFKELNIKLFVFGIGDDWFKNASDVQPMTNFAKSVGGKIASVEKPEEFQALVNEIDALARANVHLVHVEEQHNALLLLLAIAAVAFSLYLGLTALRRSSL